MVCGGMHAGSITDFESVGMQAADAGFLKLAYQRVASNFECTLRDKACGQSRGIFCGQCAEELTRGAAHACDASVLLWVIATRCYMLDAWVV